ncbi:MAG: thioredoxin family protein [Chrysiogenales bacterium]|nr:MAG: thioredoxin family protein [Chrysiogenales bacterium]
MKLEILGSGCAKCAKLEEITRRAAEELGIDADIIKVKDIKEIMDHGVMITPALVVDGEVKVAGKIPSIEDVKKIISTMK